MAEKRQKKGTGTFRKRKDGLVELRVPLGSGPDGKRRRLSFYGETEAACRKKYKEYLKSGKADRAAPIGVKTTVAQWGETWLETYRKPLVSYGTYRNDRLYFENFIRPILGKMQMGEVLPAHIMQLLSAAKNRKGKPLSESARHNLRVVCKTMFDAAVENQVCESNPVGKDKKRDLETQISIKVFPLDAIKKIMESEHPDAIIPKLLLLTGMRRGELAAWQWADIDWSEGATSISRASKRAESGGYEYGATKSGHERYTGLTPTLIGILSKLPRRGLFVLTNEDGTGLTPRQVEYRYERFFRQTGIYRLSPHKCRHTYGTYLTKGGASLRSVQDILGHSKSEVTELYTHIDLDDIKAASAKLSYL